MNPFRSGVVALIGRPNAGKSTLVNTVLGQKVSIMSNKVQTTQHRILAIHTDEQRQVVFVDTPGIHKPITKLGQILNETAQQAMFDVDIILVVIDSSSPPGKDDYMIAQMLQQAGAFDEKSDIKIILCLNKMDRLKAENVERNITEYTKLFKSEKYMLTSLIKKQNIDKLIDIIHQELPEGPAHYPTDMVTDQSMRFLAAEFIREHALHLTREEVPHSLATQVDLWDEIPEKKMIHIMASIIVERDGHKAIIIGKKGSMLKKIGTVARLEIEKMTEKKVFLEIHVKVKEGWRTNPRMLKDLNFL